MLKAMLHSLVENILKVRVKLRELLMISKFILGKEKKYMP